MEEKAKMDNRSRMSEIRAVLFRNHITRGVTPEKLRVILEELGPTYIKLGQIMSLHSDILPRAYCDELIKLNSDVMVNWLVEDKKGRLVKDDDVWDEHLWAFLQELANHGNTLGMKRRFRSTLRGEITVSGGDYGYMVNQIVEHDLLMEDLPACKKETRRPSYYLTPYNEETENDGIGKSYIEVDLAAQHVWCYIDGELKMDCDCVSGNTTDGHATPTGVFGIMFMKKDTTLRGVMQKNGEYEYETKVGYWMPFYDGCGFHDAWWRTAFGGNIYKGDGSHGCVNLPVDGAEALFSYCDEKMPVVVYE